MARKQFGIDELADAMCMWEHVHSKLKLSGAARRSNKWLGRVNSAGVVAARYHVASLLPALNAGYDVAANAGFDEAYDWEFVPWFLEECTDDLCELHADYVIRCTRFAKSRNLG